MANQEKDRLNNEKPVDTSDLESIRKEQQEIIKDNFEKSVETKSHESEDDARKEALESVSTAEKEKKNELDKVNGHEKRKAPASKRERDISFDKAMKEVHLELSSPSRVFSSFIHNKAVERVSDAVGATIARPNAILSGSVFAFIFTLVVYLIARYNGYPLSGAETIASFALGWVVGVIVDYIRLLINGKHS